MTLLHLLSYGGFVLAAAFVILSLASGLLWISELIEEHSKTAKLIGIRAIYAVIILQTLLYFTDSLPLFHSLFSIICHAVYLQNLGQSWPFISLTSASFVASCVLAITNHFLWFFYYSDLARNARTHAHAPHRWTPATAGTMAPGFSDIATFFAIFVWLIPLFLFLSLSANDNALPVASSDASCTPMQPIMTRTSLFKSVVDFLPWIRRRSSFVQGVLVSHTPTHSTSPSRSVSIEKQTFTGTSSTVMSHLRTSEDTSWVSGLENRTRILSRPPPKGPPLSGAHAAATARTKPEDSFTTGTVSVEDSEDFSVLRRQTSAR